MRNILPFSQSTFYSWGVDMGWFCSVCEKSFSRKDSMQRHVMSKHRNVGLNPFQTVPVSSKKCQWFRFEHRSFHLHVFRNDRDRKNALGSISITASLRGNSTFPGEDRLVLFTMAACVFRNTSDTTHWVRQGNSYGFGAGFLFWCETRKLIVFLRSNDWRQ